VTALRPFGEWNDVPTDAGICAVLRSWFERFSAVPVGLTGDTLELWLDQPIRDPKVAGEVASEMYGFCTDIVDQGVGSVQDLAQAILNNRVWYFWWD
jgi:hypothetical protein